MTTTTALGLAGDALNVGLEGSREEVLCAMRAAGWRPADPITFRSSFRIADSVLLRRAYPTAPVSDLYYDGRRQDLAFEKAAGISPKERHHVRFWLVLAKGEFRRAAMARLGDVRPQRRRQPLHRPSDASHRARHRRRARPAGP